MCGASGLLRWRGGSRTVSCRNVGFLHGHSVLVLEDNDPLLMIAPELRVGAFGLREQLGGLGEDLNTVAVFAAIWIARGEQRLDAVPVSVAVDENVLV